METLLKNPPASATPTEPEPLPFAVFYTDGGCRPNPGIGGWGVHGYVATRKVPKSGAGCTGFYPSADGYIPSANRAGGSPEVTILEYVDGVGSLIPNSTNNEAELVAIQKILQYTLDVLTQHPVLTITIWADSEYALKAINTWAPDWSKRGWVKQDGDVPSNKAILIDILQKVETAKRIGIQINWRWVKGHNGHHGNEMADKLATRGIIVGRKGVIMDQVNPSEPKGYWAPKNDYNRLIAQTRWFFKLSMTGDAHRAPDGRYAYYLTEPGEKKDDNDVVLFGKPDPNTSYSIVYLKEPDPAMEAVRAYQHTIQSSFGSGLILGRLDNILRPATYSDMLHNGGLFLQRLGLKSDLFDTEENPVTREAHPPGKAFKAVECYAVLEMLLSTYLEGSGVNDGKGIMSTDITSYLYEKDSSKKKVVVKLKSEIDSSLSYIDVPVNYNVGAGVKTVNLRLTLGLDITTRNTLAAIADEDTLVEVLTWIESPTAIRYATVIRTREDAGIWAAFYSNVRIVTP